MSRGKMNHGMFESLIKSTMSRGKVVLDENLHDISSELRNRNIHVILSKISEDYFKESILAGRLFVTNNSKDFVDDASSYEYGIVSTEKIKFKDSKKLAKMISDAIIKFKLWSQTEPFVLVLHEDGKHLMKSLHDSKR